MFIYNLLTISLAFSEVDECSFHVTVLDWVLQMLVAGFTAHVDVGRAHEIANEVRRVGKQLRESQTMAQTYNNRERLFGIPVTNVSEERGEHMSTFFYFRQNT